MEKESSMIALVTSNTDESIICLAILGHFPKSDALQMKDTGCLHELMEEDNS